jgi:hypothetical protein
MLPGTTTTRVEQRRRPYNAARTATTVVLS